MNHLHSSLQASVTISSCLLKCFIRDGEDLRPQQLPVSSVMTHQNLPRHFCLFSQRLSRSSLLATCARLGHHVLQLPVLHFLLVHDQHAHGHVLVRHARRRGNVPDAKVVDDRLDDGVVRGMVAVVEHPRAVALAEPRVVHRRSDEVVTPAELVEGEAERVQLAAVLGNAGFAFVVGDIRDDGVGGGGGERRGGRHWGVFQNVQRMIFGLRKVFGAATANRRMP